MTADLKLFNTITKLALLCEIIKINIVENSRIIASLIYVLPSIYPLNNH